MKLFKLLSVILISVAFSSCTKDKGTPDIPDEEKCDSTVSYITDIRPLVNAKCVSCHDGVSTVGGDFNTYEALKIQADNGRLHELVIVNKSMPADNTLSKEELKKFRCWLENGAQNN